MPQQFNFVRSRARSTIGLTPLIDVVFILLLFFMLATNFKRSGAIDLQVSKENPIQGSIQHGLRLRILDSGGVLIDDNHVKMNSLAKTLVTLYTAGGNQPVFVDVESEVNVQTLVSILDLVREAGFVNLSVSN